ILLSEAFDSTLPFGEEITKLLSERKRAIVAGDEDARRRLEAELLRRNPEHFAYFEIDEKLATLAGRLLDPAARAAGAQRPARAQGRLDAKVSGAPGREPEAAPVEQTIRARADPLRAGRDEPR